MTTAVPRALARLGQVGAPLGERTTYRVGGRARVLVTATTVEDLRSVGEVVAGEGWPVLVVGRGSNLLVADSGFDGAVVVLGEPFATVELGPGRVRAGGATLLPVLARQVAAAGRRGLEWAVGVPGSVGGAVRMNAGGHGSDVAAVLERVRVVDLATGDDGEVAAADLALGYRSSAVQPSHVVVEAVFRAEPGDRAAAEAELAAIVRWRREHQPGGQNAGSVFTNPPGDAAGRIIDELGLRGLRIGTARVSEKHANFIQADEGGRAGDVLAVMRAVRRRVHEATGLVLRVEQHLVGFGADPLGDGGEVP